MPRPRRCPDRPNGRARPRRPNRPAPPRLSTSSSFERCGRGGRTAASTRRRQRHQPRPNRVVPGAVHGRSAAVNADADQSLIHPVPNRTIANRILPDRMRPDRTTPDHAPPMSARAPATALRTTVAPTTAGPTLEAQRTVAQKTAPATPTGPVASRVAARAARHIANRRDRHRRPVGHHRRTAPDPGSAMRRPSGSRPGTAASPAPAGRARPADDQAPERVRRSLATSTQSVTSPSPRRTGNGARNRPT